MRYEKTNRGFGIILEEKYQNVHREFTRLIQESSAIGNYESSYNSPGSSFLWVGEDHHLNRDQVKVLIDHLQYWLDNGKLNVLKEKKSVIKRIVISIFKRKKKCWSLSSIVDPRWNKTELGFGRSGIKTWSKQCIKNYGELPMDLTLTFWKY